MSQPAFRFLLMLTVRPALHQPPLVIMVDIQELSVFVISLGHPMPLAVAEHGFRFDLPAMIILTGLSVQIPFTVIPFGFEGTVGVEFLRQIFAMVIAMSSDFVLSHDMLKLLLVLWWFFLTAVFLLVLKGRGSSNNSLHVESIGLALIMNTTLLFNYPYYLMLGLTGILLLCQPDLLTSKPTRKRSFSR